MKLSDYESIMVCGEGTQTSSFMNVEDCEMGTEEIMHYGFTVPINLGPDELITIDELVDVMEQAVEV